MGKHSSQKWVIIVNSITINYCSSSKVCVYLMFFYNEILTMSVPRASSNPSLLPPPPVSPSFLSTLVPPPLSESPPPPLPLVNDPSPPPPRTLLRREKTWTAVPAAPRMLPSPPSCRPRRPPASPRLSLKKRKKGKKNK